MLYNDNVNSFHNAIRFQAHFLRKKIILAEGMYLDIVACYTYSLW